MVMRPYVKILFLLFCTLLVAGAPSLRAQGVTAAVSGTVSDSTGAVIPGAQVTVTNIATQATKKVASDEAGVYRAGELNPGVYEVVITAPGFDQKKVTGLQLAVAQSSHQDVTLTLGSSNEVVTVRSTGNVTETETSSVGSVIDTVQVNNIPLDSRNFYNLTQLSPAVAQPAQNSQTGYRGGFSVSGQDEIANNFIIDGYDDNDVAIGVPNFRPSIEGVQEFNLLTGIYPAEFGRVSGGQVIVSQLSGTNQLHGDLYLYLENSIGNASNYFTPVANKAALRRGQYGGTIGGPIRRDKTFFFFDYEGLAFAQQIVPSATIVPTAAQTSGLLMGTCNNLLAAGTTVHVSGLVDPTTKLAVPCTANPNQSNQLGPLVANFSLLPAFSTPQAIIGRALAAEYPNPQVIDPFVAATATAAASGGVGHYQLSETRIENANQFTIRIDHKLSANDQLSAEYNLYRDSSFEPSNNLCQSPLIPLFGCTAFQHSQLAGATWTHTFTPHLLNEFRIDYNRLAQPRYGQDATLPQSTFQNPFPQSNNALIANSGTGSVNAVVTGYATIGNANLPQDHTENQYQALDNVSWSKGEHFFKAGIDVHDNISNNFFVDDGRGSVTFSTSNVNTSKNALSDLLLGYQYTTVLNPTDQKYAALESLIHTYFQDDWKATRRLTLNLGLRYEYTTPVHEAHGNLSTVVVATPGAVANTSSGATVTPGIANAVLQNTGGFGKYLYHMDLNNFAPRFGLAFQPLGKDTTVIHAGSGVFFSAPTTLNGFLTEYRQPPFRNIATYTSSTAAPVTLVNPTGGGTAGATFALIGTDVNLATLYSIGYSAGIQQQLAPGLGLEVTYYGSVTRRITNLTNINQGVATGLASPAFYRPYAKNQNLTIIHSQGSANYNSLQVKLQQQYRNGVTFLLAYTYAKSLDDAPGFSTSSASSSSIPQNSLCPQCEYGLSDFNVKHRFVFSPVAQLPFGHHRQFLSNANSVINALVSGWQLSSLVQAQSGRPFTVFSDPLQTAAQVIAGAPATTSSQNTNSTQSFNLTDRPNQLANPNTGPKTVAKFFNTAAFAPATTTIATNSTGGTAAVFTFGNEQRNVVIGPTFVQWDATIQRNIVFHERYTAALLFQAFDLLNHPNFLNPTATSAPYALGGSLYGQLTAANQGRDLQIAAKFTF